MSLPRIFCLVSAADDLSLLSDLAEAGIDGFQVRDKAATTRELVELTHVVQAAVRPYDATVVAAVDVPVVLDAGVGTASDAALRWSSAATPSWQRRPSPARPTRSRWPTRSGWRSRRAAPRHGTLGQPPRREDRMIPRLVLLTDRSQLRPGRGLVRTVRECAAVGLRAVVVREHDLTPERRAVLVAALAGIDRLTVISSRIPDEAAHGLHLAAHQPPPRQAR